MQQIIKENSEFTIHENVMENGQNSSFFDELAGLYSSDGTTLLSLPDEIISSYRVRPGTKIIDRDAIHTYYCVDRVIDLYIPESIEYIHPMQQWNYVSKIIIDPNNTNYIIENGCLLSYDKTILIACLTFETDFVVPKTVKKIESHAFCIKSLKSIFISTNVNEIVGNPFPSEVDIASSSSMFISENNILYNSDKSILIASASRDNVIEIPESVVEIGIMAFKPAFPQEIILPNKLKRINDYAFYSIENILITTLPEALEYIGEGCLNIFGFCACLPPKITYIGSNAFEYCAYKFVSIPESLSEIEPYTFSNNSDLEKIQIPYSLCSIGEYAFSNCVSLKEFTIPYNTSIISDGLFSGCKSLKIIELHDHITKIGDCAFENCNCLEEFSIPKSVETIIGNPFEGCI